ncbi:hypothetical protein [Nocardia wallacei]|uniref:hypothetical protein n=1 Tax=Nocardia wallacei TaxID=480035 RepID=UPI002456207F|nr:hypothetical protein [Nocardia wallacei]
MNATELQSASVEHLDHQPECGSEHHVGDAKASYWARGHDGCFDALICVPCVIKNKRWVEMVVNHYYGYFNCAHCQERMHSFNDWVELVPL